MRPYLLEEAYELARKYTEQRSPVSAALIRQMLLRNSAEASPLEAQAEGGVRYRAEAAGGPGTRPARVEPEA